MYTVESKWKTHGAHLFAMILHFVQCWACDSLRNNWNHHFRSIAATTPFLDWNYESMEPKVRILTSGQQHTQNIVIAMTPKNHDTAISNISSGFSLWSIVMCNSDINRKIVSIDTLSSRCTRQNSHYMAGLQNCEIPKILLPEAIVQAIPAYVNQMRPLQLVLQYSNPLFDLTCNRNINDLNLGFSSMHTINIRSETRT